MAHNEHIKGPGLLYVTSKISRTDIMDYDTYMKWYDEDHIAEIIETSGIKSAYRYIDIDKNASKPYLAFYPMEELGFTLGAEFRNIRVKSDLLPGTGICYDLADIDVRYVGLLGQRGTRSGVAKYLLSTAMEPSQNIADAAAEKWLDNTQVLASKIPGYCRTTYYRLLYARTNAQSRALKGLPTIDEPTPEPPTWQAIHEFSEPIDASVFDNIKNEEESRAILADAKQVELRIFELRKAHGAKKFFD
ncbi:uncharacterized protein PV09_09685 [Verruconis gallopava]|uniref:EthD domain-containing protein n=1 Tax=Verruconis gallopava TaxID=253628 RepID=A0A0D2AHZ7_9PEZI|nr:uncharacterized protein PV09_09685 [Verruconis gallopava]KIV98508.1 hypothetical protein PV09_09685 [Verruconis gallopava]